MYLLIILGEGTGEVTLVTQVRPLAMLNCVINGVYGIIITVISCVLHS